MGSASSSISLSILDRYLLREFTGPFLLAVFGFVIIGLINDLFFLVELFVIHGISFLVITKLLIYKLPAIMILFFPMAVLFSVMLLLFRMAKDNEITVIRSSGISASRIVIPLLILCSLTSLLAYYTNEKVVPWTNHASDTLIRQEIQRHPPPTIKENIVFKDQENRFFYIKKVDTKENFMQDILIFENSRNFPRIITAKQAHWFETYWILSDGVVQELDKNGHITFTDKFSEMKIHTEQNIRNFYNKQKTAREMNSVELKEKINLLEKGGISTQALEVEYHMKKSIPVACLIFGIIGMAFCLNFVASGKDWWGVIFAICVSVLAVGFYFFMMAVFRALAKDQLIAPLWGAWIPNLIYGIIGSSAIIYKTRFR